MSSVATRLLLLGRPGAGKTALLQALVRATAEPSPLFKGRLRGDLVREQPGELVAYPVQFEPEAGGHGWSATLIDASGAVAQAYLDRQRPLDDGSPLALALRSADTVILVVDAASGRAQLDADFATFAEFFRLLQEARGRRTEVAGLPVYLVLAKCDRLVRPDDTPSKWLQRLEEAKRQIGLRFKEFIRQADVRPVFGSIELNLWATADRRPAFADRPARPEPLGVAELFHQALASAQAYHRLRDQAGQRLSATLLAMLAVVAAFALGIAGLVLLAPDREERSLSDRLARLLPAANAPAAVRLKGSLDALQAKLDELTQVRQDEGYAALPRDERDAAAAYSRELAAYVETYREFEAKKKLPRDAQDSVELKHNQQSLEALGPPPEYAAEWRDTRFAERWQQARQEYARLHAIIAEESNWLRQQIKQGEALQEQGVQVRKKLQTDQKLSPGEADAWLAAVRDFDTQRPRREPHKLIDGVSGLSYGSLDKFQPIRQDLEDLQALRAELRSLRATIEARLKRAA